jgi:hypothetical protein
LFDCSLISALGYLFPSFLAALTCSKIRFEYRWRDLDSRSFPA